MPTINVKLTNTSYPVVIGSGPGVKLRQLVQKHARGGRLFVVFDAQVFALHGSRILSALKAQPDQLEAFALPQGEKAKSESVLSGLYDFLLSSRISRSDVILACGGGVTTDIAGYAAATILRGIRWGAIPTTLLGMVDAAIGGKTGINHQSGKNLIGAIWQPSFVSCDLSFLQTLPRRELIAGCGELVKYAGLIGEPMLSKMRRYLAGGDYLSPQMLPSLIHAGAKYKAQIVEKDEREEHLRAVLNLGHTFGHAIENVVGYGKLLHGEAVIIGLAGALSLSKLAKPRSAKTLATYEELIVQALRLVPKVKIDMSGVASAMSLDKKRSQGKLRFVLLERPGKPYLYTGATTAAITTAIEEMLAAYIEYGGRDAASTRR